MKLRVCGHNNSYLKTQSYLTQRGKINSFHNTLIHFHKLYSVPMESLGYDANLKK